MLFFVKKALRDAKPQGLFRYAPPGCIVPGMAHPDKRERPVCALVDGSHLCGFRTYFESVHRSQKKKHPERACFSFGFVSLF